MNNKLSLRERLRIAEARIVDLESGQATYTQAEVNEIAHNHGAAMVRKLTDSQQEYMFPVIIEVQNIEMSLGVIDAAILTATERRRLHPMIADLPGHLLAKLAKLDELQRAAAAQGWNIESAGLAEMRDYCRLRYEYMTALLSAPDNEFSSVLDHVQAQIGSYSGRKFMQLYQELQHLDRGGAPINAGKRELARRWRLLQEERGRRNAYDEALDLRHRLMRIEQPSEIEIEALGILNDLTRGGYGQAGRKRVSGYRYDLLNRDGSSFSE